MDSRPMDPTYAISAPESVAVAAVDEVAAGTVVSEVSAEVGGLGVSGAIEGLERLEGLEGLEGLGELEGVVMVLVTMTTGCLTLQSA